MASKRLKQLVKQRQAQLRQQYHIHNKIGSDCANYAKSAKVDFVAVLERNIKNQEMAA